MSLFILSFITRRHDISEDEFFEHWNKVHGPKIAAWSQKHQISGYTQIHTPKATRQALSAAMPTSLCTLEADGVVIWQVPSLEKFLDAFQDPYYSDVIFPDEDNFLDRSKQITVTMGHGHQIVFDGKPIVDCVKEFAESARANQASVEQGH